MPANWQAIPLEHYIAFRADKSFDERRQAFLYTIEKWFDDNREQIDEGKVFIPPSTAIRDFLQGPLLGLSCAVLCTLSGYHVFSGDITGLEISRDILSGIVSGGGAVKAISSWTHMRSNRLTNRFLSNLNEIG